MENKVSQIPEFKRYYLSEFELYDGEEFITFNIVGIDAAKNEIQIAVTNRGKISVITYDLMTDKNGRLYFEYGAMYTRIYPDDFEEAA
ncbi:MAG TPA: hypothetical protein IAC16_00635 [Candidatus Limadaptatus stercoravium]|nr:hypothetical protein [Candidatus Limadaptatus stercoravium]